MKLADVRLKLVRFDARILLEIYDYSTRFFLVF
jgi:hypothetical protein